MLMMHCTHRLSTHLGRACGERGATIAMLARMGVKDRPGIEAHRKEARQLAKRAPTMIADRVLTLVV
jgi:hypothetical protein